MSLICKIAAVSIYSTQSLSKKLAISVIYFLLEMS